MQVRPGDSIPLRLQLFDGREDARVEARLFLPDGSGLATVELTHVAGGLYLNNEVKMPALLNVSATYVVFDGSTESQEYERAFDVFGLDRTAEAADEAAQHVIEALTPEQASFVVGELASEEVIDPFVEGKAVESK